VHMKEVVDDYCGGFGAIKFHNYFWAHYDRLGKYVQFTFYFGLYIIT
jgi:hypothetical protein